MRLAKVGFPSDFVPNPEELGQINAAIVDPEQRITLNEKGEFPWWNEVLVHADLMPLVPLRLQRVLVNEDPRVALGIDTNTAARPLQFNQKVNVVVPGFGLLLLQEAIALTDCCTDTLNEHLKEGWRIVAVCPQPDQRRPDYVIGRAPQPEKD